MNYRKIFDAHAKPATPDPSPRGGQPKRGDTNDGRVYIYTDEIELAVNLALATGRPLLVRGPSGSGKSTLAKNVAFIQGWRYYADVISSRTQAQDLLWRFDTVRRLSDALGRRHDVTEASRYIQPGVLWWACDRATAAMVTGMEDPTPWPATADAPGAVVLIDEIDKADPDVPNNLLVPLGSFRFPVPDLKTEIVAAQAPLVVITTNDERELPNAFLRRCIVTTLKRPEKPGLIAIATEHFGPDEQGVYPAIADVLASVASVKQKRGQPAPSTAEYLDAIAVSRELDIRPGETAEWQAMVMAMFTKPRTADDAT